MTTIGKVEKTSEGFLWRIGNIFTLTKGKNFPSPRFSFADNDWNLSIERENKTDCININLRKLPNFPPISIKYCMILKMLDGKKDKEYCRCDIDEIKLESGCYRSISIPESFVRETEQVPSNVLAVLCTLKLPKPIGDKNDVSLTEVYKNVLLNGKNHDLILKIGEKELRAHKDILRARSHVFESMLDHDMKEKRSGVIDVPDCDPQAMELFLSYVYCGKVETQDQNSMIGLYYIADKYDMKGLKEECSDIIRKSLSNANICEVIQLALKHSDSRLLEYSTEYFISNALYIMRTVNWQIFLKDNTTVGNELLIKSLEKKNNILSHESASSDKFYASLDVLDCPIENLLPGKYKRKEGAKHNSESELREEGGGISGVAEVQQGNKASTRRSGLTLDMFIPEAEAVLPPDFLKKNSNILSHETVHSDWFCPSLDEPDCPIKNHVPPVNKTYVRLCPRCQTPNEKRFGGESIQCHSCFIHFC